MLELTKVKKLHKDGKTIKEMETELGISYGLLYQLHKKLNLKPNRKTNSLHENIIKLASENPKMTYEEIGLLLNCTKQNVSLVCLNKQIRRRKSVSNKPVKKGNHK